MYMTEQFLQSVYVCVWGEGWGWGERYYLSMRYSSHKKQMNWKVNIRFHHLCVKCHLEPWL